MRRAIAALTVLAAFALVFAAGAPAYADPGNGNGNGQGNPPGHAGGQGNNGNGNGNGNGGGNGGGNSESPNGFNGTVKIHDGNSEDEPIKANEPHVGCTFHIHGFNFDANSSGTWNIQSWPPTGDKSIVASGTWGPADGEGDWRTAVMSLPGGDHNQGAHYKLNVDQTSPSTPGDMKHKVFWVDCPPVTAGGPTPTPTPTPTPGGGAGGGGGGGGGGGEGGGGGGAGGAGGGGAGGEAAGGGAGGAGGGGAGGEAAGGGAGGGAASPAPAVAGVEQPPAVGGVTPMVEQQAQAAQPGAQAGAQVAGQQAAPVTALPSTNTAPMAPLLLSALLTGVGMWVMRRREGDR